VTREASLLPTRAGTFDFDLLGLGQISQDRVGVVERLPAAGEKVALHAEHLLAGGQVATALLTAARLGLRCALAGAVGDDEAAERALAPLRSGGVDTSRVRRLEGISSRQAWVLVERASGERTILEKREARLRLPAETLTAEDLARTRILLVDLEHPEAAQRAAALARSAGVPVILDAERATEAAIGLAREVDFPIVSRGFAEEFSSDVSLEEALRGLCGPHTRMAVVTCGERGSVALFHGRRLQTPAPPVDVVDTTGAGDAFRGAFAWSLVRGLPAEQVLATANAVAAASCGALGAQGALPTEDS
jgi:sugar/nucleoside kinase (ribokinase family)